MIKEAKSLTFNELQIGKLYYSFYHEYKFILLELKDTIYPLDFEIATIITCLGIERLWFTGSETFLEII